MSITRIAHILFSIIIAVYYIAPQFRYFIRLDEISFMTLGYFVCFILPTSTRHFVIKDMVYAIPFILIMYIVTWNLDFHYGVLVTIMNLWVYLFPAFMAVNIISRNMIVDTIIITSIAITIVVITMFMSYDSMQEEELIMRSLSNGSIDEDYKLTYYSNGVGGYGFAYATGVFTISLLSIAMTTKKIIRYISILLFIVSILFCLNTKFATLTLALCISIFIAIALKQSVKQRTLLFFCAPIMYYVLGIIFPLAISWLGNSILTERLNEVYSALWDNGTSSTSDLATRSSYRNMCIQNVLRSPLWGNDTTGSLRWLYTHAHSTLWSHLLGTGLIGGLSYCYTYWFAIKNTYKHIPFSLMKFFLIPSISYFFVVAFFNASEFTEISFCLFFITPLIAYVLSKYFKQYETMAN